MKNLTLKQVDVQELNCDWCTAAGIAVGLVIVLT